MISISYRSKRNSLWSDLGEGGDVADLFSSTSRKAATSPEGSQIRIRNESEDGTVLVNIYTKVGDKFLPGDIIPEEPKRYNQAYTLPFSLISEHPVEITLSVEEVRQVIIDKVDELISEDSLFDVLDYPFDVFEEED